MSWEEFLRYAGGPGVSAIVGALLSVLVEYWPAYDALAPRWKRAVMFVVCLVVPVVAAAMGVASLGWPATWEATFWPALVAGFTAFVSSQAVHVRKL